MVLKKVVISKIAPTEQKKKDSLHTFACQQLDMAFAASTCGSLVRLQTMNIDRKWAFQNFLPLALNFQCFSIFFFFYTAALLLLSLFTLKKPKSDIIKMRNIGSSISHNYSEEEEEEANDEISVMDIDEPLSVVNNNDDGLNVERVRLVPGL
ncbi:unnamed protein product [Mucor hiemalis]